MYNNTEYNKNIEISIPILTTEVHAVDKEIEFSYKQGIGELIYNMITCRPDISYSLIKLSQYSTKCLPLHFQAVKEYTTT